MRLKREYVCEHCGRVFLSVNKDAKYCTRMCFINERFKDPRKTKPKKEVCEDKTCPYNLYVCCQDQKCDQCGWNPKVAKARMARYQRVRNREVAANG